MVCYNNRVDDYAVFSLVYVKGEDMSYIALYRKWRPAVFDDLVGQDNITKILASQVINRRIAHAYLFSGGRGTGKTTTAKILSKAVNCLDPKEGNPCNQCEICKGITLGNIMDVIEIDAASNNSVDDVRAMRDEVFYTPSAAKYRVYIIDEAHMLSTGAFNALLKILEEPPEHVIFILATTEPHKIPATIISRCQRYEFRQIGEKEIIDRLKIIAKDSGSKVEEQALELIAKISDGALRDAISILDQCMNNSKEAVTREKVIDIIGIPAGQTMLRMAEAISAKDLITCIEIIEQLGKEGKDLPQFISSMVRFFRDVLVCKSTNADENIYMTSSDIKDLKSAASKFEQEELTGIIVSLSELESNLRWASMPRVMIEVEMVKLCSKPLQRMDGSIEERILRLESMIANSAHITVQKEVNRDTSKEPVAVKQEKPKKKEPAKTEPAINPDDYFKDWDKVVSQLKGSGRMVLYANLIGTKAVLTDSRTLGIIFGKTAGEFGKTVVTKHENLTLLKQAVKTVTGEEMNIKCIIDGEGSEETAAGSDTAKEKAGGKIDKVTEMAQKFEIPINIIDE